MTLKSFATVALILIPGLAFAAGGGGTGASNAGNGSPGGANSDASNGNTPVDPGGANVGKGASAPSGQSGARMSGTGSIGASKDKRRETQKPQKAP